MSRLSEAAKADPGFVAQDDSVAEKNLARIKAGLVRFGTVNSPGSTRRGLLTLTESQKTALDRLRANDGTVSADDVQRILAADSGAGVATATIVRDDPVEEICRPRSNARRCGEEALGIPDAPIAGPPGEQESPQAEVPLDENSLLEHAARLLRDERSPEQVVAFGLDDAADSSAMNQAWSEARSGVSDRVAALNVAPGPADTTAYYDFHNVHIAFEHVWQEAIDQGALEVAEDLYDQIVELGGNPDIDNLGDLRGEAKVTVQSRRNLAGESSTAVCDVRDHRGGRGLVDELLSFLGLGRGSASGGCSTRPPKDPTSGDGIVRDHREQIPELLAELERRLRSAYPFTIYAANEKERSVNFGVIATYRQKWQPVGYQAGALVKSLTLTPGEARRYSTVRKTHKSRSVKEAEKHSSSRRTEESDTQRAEAEIVRKTLRKSNFSLTAEGALGGFLGDMSTTSSMEAQRESQSTKKRFREAVRKNAQEYKDERSLEISTEESFGLEVTESAEIKNGNEEIPVTYFFFELQRQFRVSERIHRVTPVVFVAQEVPEPGDIDAAWLIAHDWILQAYCSTIRTSRRSDTCPPCFPARSSPSTSSARTSSGSERSLTPSKTSSSRFSARCSAGRRNSGVPYRGGSPRRLSRLRTSRRSGGQERSPSSSSARSPRSRR